MFIRTFLLAASLFCHGAEPEAALLESITFVLGTDESETHSMYKMAEMHFRLDPKDKTDYVITSAASFVEARDHLERFPPANGRPWGLVNFVIHGNGTGQMDVPLFPDEAPASLAKWEDALRASRFQPIPDALLDEHSEIRLHGCALGEHPELLRVIGRAFGGEDPHHPVVRASRYYTCYRLPQTVGGIPSQFLCEGWHVTYAVDRPMGLMERDALLKLQCPELDVASALRRDVPRFPGDPFGHECAARFQWTLVFRSGETAPLLANESCLVEWLKHQNSCLSKLHALGLEVDQFHWTSKVCRQKIGSEERWALAVSGEGRRCYVLRQVQESDASVAGGGWVTVR